MISDSPKRFRRSMRLKDYNYAEAGAYFVTICTQDRVCLLGEVADGIIHLSDAGRMMAAAWDGVPQRFPNLELDAFVVMPNHVHGIIVLPESIAALGIGCAAQYDRGAALLAAQAPTCIPTLSDIVGAFKSLTTVEYVRGVKTKGWPSFREHLWQRSYYEHVIRDERDLNRIRQYIDENPLRWELDNENPSRVTS